MGPSVQSCGVVLRYDLGRRRNVLEQAENVGIEYFPVSRAKRKHRFGLRISQLDPEPS